MLDNKCLNIYFPIGKYLSLQRNYNGVMKQIFEWDNLGGQNGLVIATHGIIKKTQKTPPKEIEKAEEIRKQYMNNRNNKK